MCYKVNSSMCVIYFAQLNQLLYVCYLCIIPSSLLRLCALYCSHNEGNTRNKQPTAPNHSSQWGHRNSELINWKILVSNVKKGSNYISFPVERSINFIDMSQFKASAICSTSLIEKLFLLYLLYRLSGPQPKRFASLYFAL